MGRQKQGKPRRIRPQGSIPRQPEAERFSSVGQSLMDGSFTGRPEAAQSTAGLLINTYMELEKRDPSGPACGGPLLIHADGGFQCLAGCPGGTAVVHVPEALQFCDYADRLGIDADELGHTCPACTATGAANGPRMFTWCTGTEVEHQNGTSTCTLGDDCASPGEFHASGRTCGLIEPCDRCGITTPLIGV